MNNKSVLVASVVGMVIVSLVLGKVRKKQEKEDKQMTEEAMNKVVDMFNNIDFTK